MILPTPALVVNADQRGFPPVCLTFDGERVVTDTGLLAVRALEKPLGIIANLAAPLPDPRSSRYIQHSVEAILTQEVYQILAGYPDFNDAQTLRDNPLFQILADVAPDPERPWPAARPWPASSMPSRAAKPNSRPPNAPSAARSITPKAPG